MKKLFPSFLALFSFASAQQINWQEASMAQMSAGTVGAPFVVTPRRAASGGGAGSFTTLTASVSTTSPFFKSTAAADPSDTGVFRLGNAEIISWEANPTGADNNFFVDSTNSLNWAPGASTKISFDASGNILGSGTNGLQIFCSTAAKGISLNGDITGGSTPAILLTNQNSFNASAAPAQIGTSITATLNQTLTAAFTAVKVATTETAVGSGTQNLIDLFAGSAGTTEEWSLNNKGKVTMAGGVATLGLGYPAIYAAGRATAQSAANASIATYTVGAADGSFEVSANMNVTAATVLSTTLNCTYTDESNTARTMILPVQQLSGSFIAGGLITATGAWETPVMHIRCKASTAITILTAAGTFNTVTYTAEGIIKQMQ